MSVSNHSSNSRHPNQIRFRGGRNCGGGSCEARLVSLVQSRGSEWSGRSGLEIVTPIAAEPGEQHPVWQPHGLEGAFLSQPWIVSIERDVTNPNGAAVEAMLVAGLGSWGRLTNTLCVLWAPPMPWSIPGAHAAWAAWPEIRTKSARITASTTPWRRRRGSRDQIARRKIVRHCSMLSIYQRSHMAH